MSSEQTEKTEQTERVKTFKCPSCDAPLLYGGAGKMTCEYCGAEIEADAFADEEEEISEGAESWEKYGSKSEAWSENDHATLFTCTACGGEIICEEDTAATFCPYCDNPALVGSRLDGVFKPDLIVPFAIEREAAGGILSRFTKKKPLLPSSFRKLNKIESIKGVYVPYWLYDCDTRSRFVYSATRKTTWRSGDYRYTRTSYYRLYRRGEMAFERIPVDASLKMDNTLLESIEPFGLEKAIPFAEAYLSGYFANRYDDTAEDCAVRAKERVDASVANAMRGTVHGYLTVTPIERQVLLTKSDVRYALLPVWFMNTRYKDKNYTFVINGETGKMSGKLPISPWRFAAWFASLTAIVGAIAGVVTMLLM